MTALVYHGEHLTCAPGHSTSAGRFSFALLDQARTLAKLD
jgi:hypothetical protein